MKMDIVSEILENEAQRAKKYKPVAVDKHVEPEYDIGTLLISDSNDLNATLLRSNKDDYLLTLTRDNTQLLLNKVWELPTERVEEAIVVKLPEPTFLLPRAKPVPKPKPLTKWQEFAKAKGITKKKKDKLSWDEELQKWVPLYGYKRAAAEKEKSWVMEVPQNGEREWKDTYVKKSEEKSEKVAKNELQRLKNIARAKRVKIPRIGLPVTSDKASSKQLAAAVTVARASTASVGKFQAKLPKEKDARGISAIVPGVDKKRKPAPRDSAGEKQNNLSMIESILNKRPIMDMTKGVAKQVRSEEMDRSEQKQSLPKKGSRRRGGKISKPGVGKKPKGGKGERNPGKRTQKGRKRR